MSTALPWHHVHLTAADRAAAAGWYVRYLGARHGTPTPRSENLYWGENLVQIQGESVAPRPGGGRITHLGFATGNLEAACGRLRPAGIAVTAEGGDWWRSGDPHGVGIELVTGTGDALAFHHVQLESPDPESLAGWYATHLGGAVEPCPWDEGRLAIAYDSVWLSFAPGEPPPEGLRAIDHLGWFSTDLEADAARLRTAGVAFPVPPRPFGPVRLAFLRDPAGIWIELVEPPGGRIPKSGRA